MRRVFVSLDERDLPEDGEVPEGYEPKYLEFVNRRSSCRRARCSSMRAPFVSGA